MNSNAAHIIIKDGIQDGWFAELYDGKSLRQDDAEGAVSAWYRMKEYCEKHNTFIRRLGMTLGKVTISIDDAENLQGFWQAQRMWVGDHDYTYTSDPNWHWRGIGFVNPIMIAECRWLAYPSAPYRETFGVDSVLNPQNGQIVAITKYENRVAITEKQIIWKPGVTPGIPKTPLLATG